MIKFGTENSSLSSAKIFLQQGIHIIENLYVCANHIAVSGITHDAVSNFDITNGFTIFAYIISALLSALINVFSILKFIISASFDNHAFLSYFTFMSLVMLKKFTG